MTALERAARAYSKAQAARDEARDALADAVRHAAADGMAEAEIARVAGVNRMTVRAWLGKR